MKCTGGLQSFIIIVALVFSCNTKEKGSEPQHTHSFRVKFDFYVGDSLIRPEDLDQKLYVTQHGDTFLVEEMKFYVGSLSVCDQQNQCAPEDTVYHLIDIRGKKSILLEKIPERNYKSVRFFVGVDSVNNTSITWRGTQDARFKGDLDPNSNMAWDWVTGYKFLLFEGRYMTAGARRGLVFHIGTNHNYMETSVIYPTVISPEGERYEATVKVDVLGLFGPTHPVRFHEVNNAMFGEEADKVAQNYIRHMFKTP